MGYDLRFAPWLRVKRASGAEEWVSPDRITERIADDPVVALAGPRPDFDGAVLEFLIGLCSVALAPADESEWAALDREPPDAQVLRSALESLPPAFELDGDQSRVFQDRDALDGVEPASVERLLIGAPGEQGRKLNTDLFVKRDRVLALGYPAAAMALVTMQTYAPAGGQGNRTSLRGCGPLTTLVDPRREPRSEPLWSLIWANVETESQRELRDKGATGTWRDADRFPWLAPTRTSNPKDGGRPTHVTEAAPEQAYFGMPRRIRLEISPSPAICSLTGEHCPSHVAGFRMKNYGVQYEGWEHPLTPHYHDKKSGYLPRHGQPGGIGWRDWLGLLVELPDEGTHPAACVAWFRKHRERGPFRLLAFGYDMDNMKARGWVQAELPAFPDAALVRVRAFAASATAATELAAYATMRAVKQALHASPEEAAGDYGFVKHRVWSATESPFFATVGRLIEALPDGPAVREDFRQLLRDRVLASFDEYCPLDGGVDTLAWRRLLVARKGLTTMLEGYGGLGSEFFKALDLAAPEAGKPRRRKKA